jgi:oligosaccharide reducing-end xylanase
MIFLRRKFPGTGLQITILSSRLVAVMKGIDIRPFFQRVLVLSFAPLLSVAPSALLAGSKQHNASHERSQTDLFARLLGRNKAQERAKIDSAFSRLFFGDNNTERVYYPAGKDMGYVEDIANHDVRTEGMSYGMMIAVQMDRKDVFDRIWKWTKTYMQNKSGPHRGYFAWHCKTDGTVLDSNAASDGEEWFVMSLFFASARWGNGTGIFDYRKEANEILNTMLHKEDEPGHGEVTNMFNRKEKLVVFVPTIRANGFTDPSYQIPHYYELWANWAEKDNDFWREAATASRELLKKAADPTTGLSPDYCNFDGTPVKWWRGGHEDFRFDAWRVGMNVAMDCEWFGKDEWEVAECNKLLDFFESQGMNDYGNQYTLDGKELGNDHSTGLVAMNAVAALASTNADRVQFVKALWDAKIPTGLYRYYDGMLYMMGLLQVSGNFRVYNPTGK